MSTEPQFITAEEQAILRVVAELDLSLEEIVARLFTPSRPKPVVEIPRKRHRPTTLRLYAG